MPRPACHGSFGGNGLKNLRIWGKRPYKIAVVHGGPGTPGSVAAVARELSDDFGVLEPFQTKNSIDGQVEELVVVIKTNAVLPVTLIGWSWGATLSYIMAVRFSELVKKLILISMPPLKMEERTDLTAVWLDRLPEKDRVDFFSLEEFVWDGKNEDKSSSMARLFRLIAKADSYAPMLSKDEVLEYQIDINIAIFRELYKQSASLDLIGIGKNIKCPVIAIHGDYDPRPARAVQEPLSKTIKDFRFILLEKCGHYPWLEKYARDKFYKVLREEIE
jgi:pimeloyl-ACP methyl ester carboxylesterase